MRHQPQIRRGFSAAQPDILVMRKGTRLQMIGSNMGNRVAVDAHVIQVGTGAGFQAVAGPGRHRLAGAFVPEWQSGPRLPCRGRLMTASQTSSLSQGSVLRRPAPLLSLCSREKAVRRKIIR